MVPCPKAHDVRPRPGWSRLTSLRDTVRFRRWARRTRRALAREGIAVEIVAPFGATFHSPPVVEATRQPVGERPAARGGTLRIELGHDVHLGQGTVIEVLPGVDNEVRLGRGVTCFSGVRFVLFGGSIDVGDGTRARDGVTLKSSGRLTIGAHGFINNFSIVHCAREVVLGEHPQVAERVTIIDSDHVADGSDVHTQLQPIVVKPVHIGRNVWVGANAVILRGAVLEPNSVVAANSTVRSGTYPAGWLIAGSPAVATRALGPSADRPA